MRGELDSRANQRSEAMDHWTIDIGGSWTENGRTETLAGTTGDADIITRERRMRVERALNHLKVSGQCRRPMGSVDNEDQ